MRGFSRGLGRNSTTGFKGVSLSRNGNGFEARVQKTYGHRDPGAARQCFAIWRATFPSPEEAARAYDAEVRSRYGSQGPRFNFPRVGEAGLDGTVRAA